MCLQWQVAIVHNVLMLTKCQFDPWDRRVGRGCGSCILKRATARRSCGDGRRHDTDETSSLMADRYKAEGRDGGRRDEEGGRQPEGQIQVSVIGQTEVFGKRFCHFGLKVTSRVTLQPSHSDAVAELRPGDTLTSDLWSRIIAGLCLEP